LAQTVKYPPTIHCSFVFRLFASHDEQFCDSELQLNKKARIDGLEIITLDNTVYHDKIYR
jgi:hypothetical protein